MNRIWACIRIALALGSVAIVAAGCAAANNATSSQASAQTEQPYKTMYGMTSEGTTTDLYTELFGSSQPQPAPTTAVAATQPVQPVTAQPVSPVQPNATAATATAPNRRQTAAASRAQQAAPVQPPPVQVAQQPASPPPAQEPDVPAMYGITANGPSTDLYTALFGPRRSNGQ